MNLSPQRAGIRLAILTLAATAALSSWAAPPTTPAAKPAAAPAAPPPSEQAKPATLMSRLEAIRQTAVEAYNQRNWTNAAQAAGSFVGELDAAKLTHAGADFALVQFIGGHARFELWKKDPATFKYDFQQDVIGAMEESLKILQDDLFFKHNVLGTAYFEKLKADGFKDFAYENAASWNLFRALMARSEELQNKPHDSEEYTAFAKFALLYINRCFEMARHSPAADVYLVRVREACRFGFGTQFEDRFAQLYQVVGFDDGNVRAGVLWQTGLDLMNTAGTEPDLVLATFKEAADVTRSNREKAEVYRQMADFSSRQDPHNYKLQAVEFGRTAFRLDPTDKDIQIQYGTSLHVISYAHYNAGRYQEAREAAREATSFDWEGDEVGFFDLSRAEANFGDKINALTHAERAYDKARRRYSGAELVPFRQNFANILRQFGLGAKAAAIEAEGQGS